MATNISSLHDEVILNPNDTKLYNSGNTTAAKTSLKVPDIAFQKNPILFQAARLHELSG